MQRKDSNNNSMEQGIYMFTLPLKLGSSLDKKVPPDALPISLSRYQMLRLRFVAPIALVVTKECLFSFVLHFVQYNAFGNFKNCLKVCFCFQAGVCLNGVNYTKHMFTFLVLLPYSNDDLLQFFFSLFKK
ncbi:uncharacterized protein B0P05DRAFT_539800 [Gilbertella persicaria]|uniref:uncharacterized protein n=1 Tax=Gilbertella persicaria TaxID=101096 RepID=UPI00221EC1B1|nr:uncharacterized protein B0P05DRAFT_539800 [Gilbertella persicaria]KAI8080833.1 hypothetical protein B0P05DRAFT_539800 [Gilbertella persicaria]